MVSTVRPIGASPRKHGNPFITTRSMCENIEIPGGKNAWISSGIGTGGTAGTIETYYAWGAK